MKSADPITLEVVKNALSSIADEMALVILRTAYSSIVRDSMDYSTGLCDRQGRVIAFGPHGIPIGHILLPGREDGGYLRSTSLAFVPGTRDVVIVVGSAVLHILNGKVRVRPSWTGKVATVLQMAAIAWVMLQIHLFPLLYIVAAAGFFTLVSGMIYVRDGVRQLTAEGHANAKRD